MLPSKVTLMILVGIVMWMIFSTRCEGYTPGNVKNCKNKANKILWDTHDFRPRIETKDASGNVVWKCPSGWQGTGCDWDMKELGNEYKEYEKKQCRRKKTKRQSEEADGSKCTSNADCIKGRNCSYDGYCYDKDNMVENASSICTRNSHCSTGRKCQKSEGGSSGICTSTSSEPQPIDASIGAAPAAAPAALLKGGKACDWHSECESGKCDCGVAGYCTCKK